MNPLSPCCFHPGILSRQLGRKPGYTLKDIVHLCLLLWTREESTCEPLWSQPACQEENKVCICLPLSLGMVVTQHKLTEAVPLHSEHDPDLSHVSQRWGFTNWVIGKLVAFLVTSPRLVTGHSMKTAGATKTNISSENLLQKQEPS